jgi:uncharacterized protein YcbX
VRLERDVSGIPDVPGTVLVTVAGSLAALSAELGSEIDARRFRTNLHLELDADPWAEPAWAGAEIELEGGVRLQIDHACERCAIPTRDPDTQEKWPQLLRHLTAEHGQDFGLLARVRVPGRVYAGESARIVTS